jgi:hypothetical protein
VAYQELHRQLEPKDDLQEIKQSMKKQILLKYHIVLYQEIVISKHKKG